MLKVAIYGKGGFYDQSAWRRAASPGDELYERGR